MRLKIAAVVGGAAAALVVAAPFAMADDVDGGHCEYGDFSVNVEPSCDTSSSDAAEDEQLEQNSGSFDGALHQGHDIFGDLLN
jgi:hypothetical protein